MTVTQKQIDKIVTGWAKEIAKEIKAGEVQRDQPHDSIFQAVDDGWGELGFPVGRIEHWPANPGAKVLTLLGQVMEYCEEEAWLEDDAGLWAGLKGAALLGSQAFFSLENVLWEKLRKMNVID